MARFLHAPCLLVLAASYGIDGRRIKRDMMDNFQQASHGASKGLVEQELLFGSSAKAKMTGAAVPDWQAKGSEIIRNFWSQPMSLLVVAIPVCVILFLLMTCACLFPWSAYAGKESPEQARQHPVGGHPRAASSVATTERSLEEEEVVNSIKSMIANLLSISIPTIIGSMIMMANEVINLVFIGHVGNSAEIAAVGLGNTMQNCVGVYMGLGLIAGLDTLVSQAAGAERLELAVKYLQRCRAIVFAQLIWMWPILWNSESILLLIDAPPEVAYNTGLYNKVSCFFLPLFFFMYASVVWLRNIGLTGVPSLIALLCVFVQLPVAGFFILHLEWGNFGAGCANLTTCIIGTCILSYYMSRIAKERGLQTIRLFTLSGDAFTGWWEYLKVGVPATLQTICEMWYFEVIMVASGYLGQIQMASYVVIANFIGLQAMAGLAMGYATSTLVGQHIGAGKPLATRMMIVLALSMMAIMAFCMAGIVLLFRGWVAYFYTDNEAVAYSMSDLLYLVAAFVIPDSFQMMMGGALRGLNLPMVVGVVFVISYWLISLPSAMFLAFRWEMGTHGLILGNLIGATFAFFVFASYLMKQDYKSLAMRSTSRMAQEVM